METVAITPARTPQHMQALQHANKVRIARAELKRAIRRGELSAAEVVRSCPWEARTMTLGELLQTQQRWGRKRAGRFLLHVAVSENRPLTRLTERQREAVASALEETRRPAVAAPAILAA